MRFNYIIDRSTITHLPHSVWFLFTLPPTHTGGDWGRDWKFLLIVVTMYLNLDIWHVNPSTVCSSELESYHPSWCYVFLLLPPLLLLLLLLPLFMFHPLIDLWSNHRPRQSTNNLFYSSALLLFNSIALLSSFLPSCTATPTENKWLSSPPPIIPWTNVWHKWFVNARVPKVMWTGHLNRSNCVPFIAR